MSQISNDLFQSEVESIDHPRALNAIDPLRCDRWLALSAMQKSIRRGDGLTAQRALRTLYQHDPSSTWRRLLIIACEDVGIGALGAVVMTANALRKRESPARNGKKRHRPGDGSDACRGPQRPLRRLAVRRCAA